MQAQTGTQSVKPQTARTKISSPVLPQYKPTRDEMMRRYHEANLLDSTIRNKVFKTNVQANWQADGESFWYRNFLKDSTLEYIFVDVLQAQKRKAFDHTKFAQAVGRAAGKTYDASRLRISNMFFENNAGAVTFQMDGQWWRCDLTSYECTTASAPPGFRDNTDSQRRFGGGGRGNFNPNELGPVNRRARSFRSDSLSPDKQWAVFAKNGNVFIKPSGGGEETQLTTDGTTEKPYGQFNWSPDSKNVVAYHINPVKDKEVYYVLSSAGGTRGQLRARGYAQPGDSNTSYEMFVLNVADKKKTRVEIDDIDFLGPPYLNWRKDDASFFTFERTDRGHQRFRIIEVNANSGKAREIVDEKTNTFIFEQRIFTVTSGSAETSTSRSLNSIVRIGTSIS